MKFNNAAVNIIEHKKEKEWPKIRQPKGGQVLEAST